MWIFGDLRSGWSVLALPGAVLIGFGFAGVGLAATTYMRSFVDFDYVNMAMIPLFLFSATFFPLSQYPAGLPGDRPAARRCTKAWCWNGRSCSATCTGRCC